jgi:hypothetical protein
VVKTGKEIETKSQSGSLVDPREVWERFKGGK